METIKYNKAYIQAQFSVERKLKDIVAELENMAKADDKVICRVRVNGLLLSEEDENRFAATDQKDIEEIEIELESMSRLILSSVQALSQYAAALKESAVKGADLFREGNSKESNIFFAAIVPRIQCFNDALVALKPNLERAKTSSSNLKAKWAESETAMLKTVHELIQAYEKQDFVLVSDVLEYELYNSIDNWMKILYEL